MMKPIIEVHDLSKKYGEKVILKGLSFQVNPGETVALLGENGAGKSTLINLLNQLIAKDAGEITMMGTQEITTIREGTGVMLQSNLSLNKITVKELLSLARSYYQRPLSYEELLIISDLKEAENRYVNLLSGGQKRRLTFAAAMAGDPQLVFLDEPTAGMDSQSRRNFWQLIAQYQQQGKTFFVTSHYLEELDTIADRIMILKDAQLLYNGTLQNLKQNTGDTVITFTTPLPKATFAILSTVKTLTNHKEHYQLITDRANDTMAQLAPFLPELQELSIQQNTLESLYTKLIKE